MNLVLVSIRIRKILFYSTTDRYGKVQSQNGQFCGSRSCQDIPGDTRGMLLTFPFDKL